MRISTTRRKIGLFASLVLVLGESLAAYADAPKFTKTVSGLEYAIIHPGTGRTPRAGDLVVFQATGKLDNGFVFENSRKNPEPNAMEIGPKSGWMAGLTEAINLLRVGDRAMVTIPPDLGYDDSAAKFFKIPPHSLLHYDIEVLSIKTQYLAHVLKPALDAEGVEGARRLFVRLKAAKFPDVYEGSGQLNFLGYYYLSRQDHPSEAIALFRWNVELYPRAADLHDSLAEAYLMNDQTLDALREYELALKLAPSGEEAKVWRDRIQKLKSPTGISALELMKVRLRVAGAGFEKVDGRQFAMSVPTLQWKMELCLSSISTSEDVSSVMTAFIQIVEHANPQGANAVLQAFRYTANESARKTVEAKLTSSSGALVK